MMRTMTKNKLRLKRYRPNSQSPRNSKTLRRKKKFRRLRRKSLKKRLNQLSMKVISHKMNRINRKKSSSLS